RPYERSLAARARLAHSAQEARWTRDGVGGRPAATQLTAARLDAAGTWSEAGLDSRARCDDEFRSIPRMALPREERRSLKRWRRRRTAAQPWSRECSAGAGERHA